jgi:peptidoglycan/xylan/chitin deacetylase (PgdA/CDA1 family)
VRVVLSSCPPRKRQLAAVARAGGGTAVAAAWERRHPALRVVNLHSVPGRFADAFHALLQGLSRSWTFASPSDLPDLLARGVDRRTLLFCFDDGLANTIEYAAPILETAGARAIFAVPAAWPDIPVQDQADWFRRHVYPAPTELHDRPGDVGAPSWEDLRNLVGRGHEVWSHGVDHLQLRADLPDQLLEREIIESKEILERNLGTPVRGYCPPINHTVPRHGRAMIAATYELAFGGRPARIPVGGDVFSIPRSNVEASWPREAVDFQLSPLGDAVAGALARLRS